MWAICEPYASHMRAICEPYVTHVCTSMWFLLVVAPVCCAPLCIYKYIYIYIYILNFWLVIGSYIYMMYEVSVYVMGCVRAFVSLPAYISVLTLHQHIYTHKYTFMHTNARVHVHVRTHTRPTHTHTHTNIHKYTHFSFFQALSCLTLKRRFWPISEAAL